MTIKIQNFIYKFLSISLFILPIQAMFVFLFNLPNSLQYLYLFLIIGFLITLLLPYRYITKSIDKTFIILFILLLISILISLIINYESVMSKGMEFTYFTSVYSKFWDRPDIRMLNWGILRPFLFFTFACLLFIFFNLKYGIKVALQSIIYLGIISSIYSIYQVIAAFLHLPYASIFSGHHGNEIYLFGNLRRVEGLFYEPGPQATFLSPIFCIMFFQLFQKDRKMLLFTKKNIYYIFIILTIALICTFSPIAFLTIPLCIILAVLLNLNSIKLRLSKKILNYLCISVIAIIILCSSTILLIKNCTKDFSISQYMIEKILISTTSLDSPRVYLNPDSRSVRAYVGLNIFKDHPIFGAGPSSSIAYFFKYANFTSSKYGLRDQHAILNTHIKILCEYGIIGFTFYLLLLLYPIYLYIKRYKVLKFSKQMIDSLLISYIIYILISFQSTLQFWMPYFWIVYVLLVVLLNNYSKLQLQ